MTSCTSPMTTVCGTGQVAHQQASVLCTYVRVLCTYVRRSLQKRLRLYVCVGTMETLHGLFKHAYTRIRRLHDTVNHDLMVKVTALELFELELVPKAGASNSVVPVVGRPSFFHSTRSAWLPTRMSETVGPGPGPYPEPEGVSSGSESDNGSDSGSESDSDSPDSDSDSDPQSQAAAGLGKHLVQVGRARRGPSCSTASGGPRPGVATSSKLLGVREYDGVAQLSVPVQNLLAVHILGVIRNRAVTHRYLRDGEDPAGTTAGAAATRTAALTLIKGWYSSLVLTLVDSPRDMRLKWGGTGRGVIPRRRVSLLNTLPDKGCISLSREFLLAHTKNGTQVQVLLT
jgi:hypothetical protein